MLKEFPDATTIRGVPGMDNRMADGSIDLSKHHRVHYLDKRDPGKWEHSVEDGFVVSKKIEGEE